MTEHNSESQRQTRNYDFEAIAEVTHTDWNAGRGELNKALMLIREQSEIEDSYLLSAEIHDRAKMYRALFPNAALTPTALAKHWLRVYEETQRRPKLGPPPELPKSRREENLEEARKLMATLWGGRQGEDHEGATATNDG
ncbi:MAG TPA: hypothetical protein VLD59_01410 [Steroidobacteraceae bacterium]|nr:hypothetical protein [Steroidobacteraceae bacterium]